MEGSRRITHINFVFFSEGQCVNNSMAAGWILKNFMLSLIWPMTVTHEVLAVFPEIYLCWLRCGSIHKILQWQEEAPEHDTAQPFLLYHPNPTDLYRSNHTWTNLDLLYWKCNYHNLWERRFSVSDIGSSEEKNWVHKRSWTYDLLVTIMYYHSRIMHISRDRAEGGAGGALAPPLFCKNKNKFNKK